MKKVGHSLRLVAAALDGALPPDGDWFRVLEIANRGWLGPALYLAPSRGRENAMPSSVRDYLAFLHERNCERNRRLRDQLCEAVTVLNKKGTEPNR